MLIHFQHNSVIMKSIFEYLDYRDYLKDFYESRKAGHSYFSYRLFGSKTGLDASYLAKVLIKSRHIADSSIAAIISYCGLKDQETEYFETLVHFVKAKSHRESKLLFEKLLSLKSVGANKLIEAQYEFYQKWYYSAIRSIIEFYDFRGSNYQALGDQLSPQITAKQAKESIQLLEKLQLICKDVTGRYKMTDASITTGTRWQSLAIRAFQEETIRLSQEALSRHPKQMRNVSTVTMNVNEDHFREIEAMIKDFRNTIVKYVNDQTDPDRVMQLNIQLFPLSKVVGRTK
jgi:uncharacterized protein (TIGR02147 family)